MAKNNNTPSWLKDVTNTEKELKTEAFKPIKENNDVVDYNGFLVLGVGRSAKKTEYAQVLLKIEQDLKDEIDTKCQGSRNSILNALIAYALRDLKETGKTLIVKE